MTNLDPAKGSAEARADAAASFDPLRRTLIRVAYRMLGSVADAEDMVQDAFIQLRENNWALNYRGKRWSVTYDL